MPNSINEIEQITGALQVDDGLNECRIHDLLELVEQGYCLTIFDNTGHARINAIITDHSPFNSLCLPKPGLDQSRMRGRTLLKHCWVGENIVGRVVKVLQKAISKRTQLLWISCW